MTQQELSVLLHVSRTIIGQVETGQMRLDGKLRAALTTIAPDIVPAQDHYWAEKAMEIGRKVA